MKKYIGKKIVMTIVALFFVVTICFFLFELMPGDAYNFEVIHNDAYITNIRSKYGLDKSVLERYWITLNNFMRLDFGYSYINTGLYANDIIKNGFKISAPIGISAVMVSTIMGTGLGVLIFKVKNNKLKQGILMNLLLIMCIPSFVIAIIAQYVLCVRLKVFPSIWNYSVYSSILPVEILSIVPTAYIARMLSISLEKEQEEEYVISSKCRGETGVLIKYMLKRTITPIISYLGQLMAGVLVGSFVVETVFNIPGMGRQFVISVSNRDYPLVMGLIVFYSSILVFTNFMADLMICLIEPRVKEGIKSEEQRI